MLYGCCGSEEEFEVSAKHTVDKEKELSTNMEISFIMSKVSKILQGI